LARRPVPLAEPEIKGKAEPFQGRRIYTAAPQRKYLPVFVTLHEALGAFMLNRLTVSALLKIVLLATSLWVVVGI
jgi:hypothetical protein